MSYNGSAIVCMAGKNCVAIASDTRYVVPFSFSCVGASSWCLGVSSVLAISGSIKRYGDGSLVMGLENVSVDSN